MSINQAQGQAQAQQLRQFKLRQAAVQAQAQADRREAAQRPPENGQFGAYGFRTLPQPTAAQAKPTRLPLRENPGAATFRVPGKEVGEGLAGLMELLTHLGDDGSVDADGESSSRGGRGGGGGDAASSESGHGGDSHGQGEGSAGDAPGRDSGGNPSGGQGGGSGRGGDGREGGRGDDRGRAAADRSLRLGGADGRREWTSLPQARLQDVTPLLARLRKVERPVAGADEGAHALASSLITFGAATAPPGRPGVGALRLAAMAAYIDAQSVPGALGTLAGVKEVLMTHVSTARAAAASPAGARAPNQWALLPLELLVCDKPRTAGQRRLAVERLQAAHGFLGRFKESPKGKP